MTAIAVPCPPPRADRVHERLVSETGRDGASLASFLAAVCQDTLRAAVESGGEAVAVPVSLESPLPDWSDAAATTASIAEAVTTDDDAFPVADPITGEADWPSRALDIARERSEASTVAIVLPLSPLVQRRHVDAAAMQLRSHDMVLGPTTGSGWYFLGVDRDLDLDGAEDAFDIHDVAGRAIEDGRSLSTIEFLPGYRSADELRTLTDLLDIADWADDAAAPYTRQWLEEAGRART